MRLSKAAAARRARFHSLCRFAFFRIHRNNWTTMSLSAPYEDRQCSIEATVTRYGGQYSSPAGLHLHCINGCVLNACALTNG